MSINPIQKINTLVGTKTELVGNTGETAFKSIFQMAMNNLDTTGALITKADEMSVDFAAGKIDNVADLMIAQEKASIALQYTVQLRNKILDSYNEIMRMQV